MGRYRIEGSEGSGSANIIRPLKGSLLLARCFLPGTASMAPTQKRALALVFPLQGSVSRADEGQAMNPTAFAHSPSLP